MRRVNQKPTVTKDKEGNKHFKENAPVYIYDTSGPYSDPKADIDLKRGLPALRTPWILERGGVELLSEPTSDYCRQRLADHALDHLRFGERAPIRRALPGKLVTQMALATLSLTGTV